MRTHQPAVQHNNPAPLIMRKTCSCGRPMGPSGECAACQRKRLGVQAKLRVNQPGDRYEREADKVADSVMGMEEAVTKPIRVSTLHSGDTQSQVQNEGVEETPAIQRQEDSANGVTPIDNVETSIQSFGNGNPLAPHIRSYFEARFGHDFSRVRVHNDAQAEAASRSLNARAFTVGNDIVFGAGEYAPETNTGKHLLAHELTHVRHQMQGNPNSHRPSGNMLIQRQAQSTVTNNQSFKKKVQRILILADKHQVLVEHEDGSVVLAHNVKISGNPVVGQGTIKVNPTAGKFDQDLDNEKVIWNATWTYPKISTLVGVDQIIIEVVDPNIVKLVFGGTARPKTYNDPALVNVLDKMRDHGLSEEELYDLRKKGGRPARSWKEVENALDNYLTERKATITARVSAQVQLQALSDKLSKTANSKELYITYQEYQLRRIFRGVSDDSFEKFEDDFIAKLQQADFEGIDDYEQTLWDYQEAFENETRQLAYDVLANLDRILEQNQKEFAAKDYNNPENPQVIQLIKALDPIREGVRRDYQQVDTLREEAEVLEARAIEAQRQPLLFEVQSQLQTSLSGMSVQTPKDMLLEAGRKRRVADKIESDAEIQVARHSKPLLSVTEWQDFPHRSLIENTKESNVRNKINFYLASRRGAIRRTRKRLEGDRKLIYHLDTLLEISRKRQGVTNDSVLGMIIAHQRRKEIEESWLVEMIQILALALSFFGGFTGVIAATVAAGASSYQVIDEYQKLEIAQDAFEAQLSSQDPSSLPFWLALAGGVLDLGGLAGVIGDLGSVTKILDDAPVTPAARSGSAERSLQQVEPITPPSGAIKIETIGGKRTVGIKSGKFTMCRNPCASFIEKLEVIKSALPENYPGRGAIDELLERVNRSQDNFQRGLINEETAYSQLQQHTDELQAIQDALPDVDRLVSMDLDVLLSRRDNLKEAIAKKSSIDYGDPTVYEDEKVFGELGKGLQTDPPSTVPSGTLQDFMDESVRLAKEAGFIDSQGNPLGVDTVLTPHRRASDLRNTIGISGQQAESAHLAATALVRSLPGYSRNDALTRILPKIQHKAFDRHWLNWVRRRRQAIAGFGSSNFEAPLFDILEAQRRAIRQIPGLPLSEINALESQLAAEFYTLAVYTQDGLRTTVPLPKVR